MRTRIKVCGITRVEDARLAIEAGADALGFVFAASPRRVDRAMAREIVRALPPFVATVGVFVDEEPREVVETAAAVGLTAVQLHGDESPAVLRELRSRMPLKMIKAFRVRAAGDLARLDDYRAHCDALLLDAYVPGAAGGTGRTFDWELARLARAAGHPLVLAGGLTPENVSAAVRRVRPFAVDVSSGVEAAPGRKDALRVRAFVAAAREADATACPNE